MVFLITTLAFVQSLIVAYLLRLRTAETRNYPYIKALLVLIVLHLGIKFYLLGVLNNAYLFGRLTSFTSFAYGPLLYFQYRHSIGKPLYRRWQFVHLTPFFAAFITYVASVAWQLPFQNPALFRLIFEGYSQCIVASVLIYPLVLLLLTYTSSRPHGRDIILIRQISYLLFLGVGGGWLAQWIAVWVGQPIDGHLVAYAFFGAISFLCLRFFYETPAVAALEVVLITDPEKEAVSYEKSGLTTAQMTDYWQALETLMQRQKPYLEPEVSLDDLATKLRISRQHVSQVLNLKAGKNFYAYVNEYRVGEMLRLMIQKPDARISELALRVGFQSKTTLNTYFKKVTGLSPTEYQQGMPPKSKSTLA